MTSGGPPYGGPCAVPPPEAAPNDRAWLPGRLGDNGRPRAAACAGLAAEPPWRRECVSLTPVSAPSTAAIRRRRAAPDGRAWPPTRCAHETTNAGSCCLPAGRRRRATAIRRTSLSPNGDHHRPLTPSNIAFYKEGQRVTSLPGCPRRSFESFAAIRPAPRSTGSARPGASQAGHSATARPTFPLPT